LLHQALASWQQYHSGEDHPTIAAITENLGRALEKRQAYEAAEPLYRDALAMWKRLQGEKHPDIAISLYPLRRLLHATTSRKPRRSTARR